MSLLFRVIYAAHASSTHHKLALDALEHLDCPYASRWRDVFLNNREAVLEMLQRFTEDLTALQRAIRWGEGETLEAHFRKTREIRRGIVEAKQAGNFDPREPAKKG